MKKIFKDLNLNLYSKTLDNGLNIYIVPMKNKHDIYVTFTTKFGSNINEFKLLNSNDYIKVPYGVAHFLEHKMFEQEDGEDPFSVFSHNGANANAYTTYDHTTYLFSGPNKFYENLKCLLNFVQEPYFTDENVEKEKGIIEQERLMYQDDPDTRMHDVALYNLLNNYPLKFPIIGTKESINNITKDDLYNCYNTFYHPSNMFLVITGNVDVEKTFDFILKNQNKKNFIKNDNKLQVKQIKEEKYVEKNFEKIKMDVNIPKLSIAYKINIENVNLELYDLLSYLTLYFDIKLGITSNSVELLKNKNLIFHELGMDLLTFKNYVIVRFFADTNSYQEVTKIIDSELNNKNILIDEFERKKKCNISSLILSSDSIFSVNKKIVKNIVNYNSIIYNELERLNNLSYDKLIEIINNISFAEKTVVLVENDKA